MSFPMVLLDFLGILYEALHKKTWLSFAFDVLCALILAGAIVAWSALT